MKIHLIRDTYLQEEIYNEIVSFLNDSNGLMKFVGSEETYEEVKPKSHQDYYDVCNAFRRANTIKEKEIVIFLSSTSFSNFFSLTDFKKNIYVKTTSWKNFVDSQIRYPIIIEIVTNILHLLMFDDLEDVQQKTHMNKDRGCLNDYNQKLDGVKLRLKSPDLCDDCLDLINPKLISYNVLEQIFEIVDKSSIALKKIKRYFASIDLVELEIKKHHTKLYFKDPLNHTLRIPPIPF
ncbi:MAG: hypothetical protein H8E84_00400, partial [Flavobacteriales bacterium]|nr:hypothetical protein [Flavobacteriales bacterium]